MIDSSDPGEFGDLIQPFQIDALGVRGRIVRLSRTVSQIAPPDRYPIEVGELLAATMALGSALAGSLKYEGVFTLQAQGNGPVSLLLADVTSNGDLRGYARFDNDEISRLDKGDEISVSRLLGAGHLAFTVDQGEDMERYQGITELTGTTLADCAQTYFRQSEQLETAIILESARSENGAMTAAAFVAQKMPDLGPEGSEEGQDAWREAAILTSTVSKSELLDPNLPPNDLLYRLYHEHGVRVFDRIPLRHACRCSREKVERTLASFPQEEVVDMKEDGKISVTCEFCGTLYAFDDTEIQNLYA